MSIKKALIILLFLLSIFQAGAFARKETVGNGKTLPAPETRSELMLGTVCRITLYDQSDSDIFTRAFARIEDIENQMSLTSPNSVLAAVNRLAGTVPIVVPEDTFAVIEEALIIAELSGGAFDPTIGPLVLAWGIGSDDPRVPSEGELKRLLELVDYRRVKIDPAALTVFPEASGMILDLGGIAKGYAADQVREFLMEEGVTSALINLGGNVLTIGAKPDGSAWRIGIQDPDKDRGSYVMIVSVNDASIVTSGAYERFFVSGNRTYHHILDPASGFPAESDVGSVSIISRDSFIADALSTAFYVMGLEAGMELIERLDEAEAAAVTWNKEIVLSSGFSRGKIGYSVSDPEFTVITMEEYRKSR